MVDNELLSVSFRDSEEMEAVECTLKIRFRDVRQRGTHVGAFFVGEGLRRTVLLVRDGLRQPCKEGNPR